MLETARAAFEASSQRVSLTNLSGRRDMSLLLALSATQVRFQPACTCVTSILGVWESVLMCW